MDVISTDCEPGRWPRSEVCVLGDRSEEGSSSVRGPVAPYSNTMSEVRQQGIKGSLPVPPMSLGIILPDSRQCLNSHPL